jgi:hypothetical protein
MTITDQRMETSIGQGAEASSVPARSRKRFDLVEDCRALILERITQTVAQALNRMSDELTAEALRSTRSDQQQALLDAVMLVRENRIEIESRFRRSFSDVFERRLFAMNAGSDSGEPTDAQAELTLVSDDVMNDRLSIDRLIGKTRSRLDPDEVLGIRARLGALLERDWFEESMHPVSPEAVFEALKSALAELSPRHEVKAALLDAFEPHVTQNLNGIYAVVNERLRANQVLPKIRPQVQPVGSGVRRAAPEPRGEAASGAAGTLAHPGAAGAFIGDTMPLGSPGAGPGGAFQAPGPGGGRFPAGMGAAGEGPAGYPQGGAGRSGHGPGYPGNPAPGGTFAAERVIGGASDYGFPDDPAEAFRQAMAAASEGRPGGRANVARMLTNPLMFGLADLPVAPVQPPLVASLTALQRGPVPLGAASMLPEVVEQVREQGSPLDQITVEIVSMVFDYIYADRRLPDSIKQQLLRLQVVAVKAALLDRSFFARRQHPMRRLIDRISDVGADPDADLAPGSVLVVGLGSVVDRIIAEFDADLAVFDQALQTIESLARDEAERRAARVEETARRAALEEALSIAHEEARAELGRRIDKDTPPFVREFLHRWWVGVLARLGTEPAGDAAAPSWDTGLQTADYLVWSVAPKQTDEITRLATVLPALIRGLNQGLERVDIPASERAAFFDELLRAHTLEIAAAKKRAHAPPAVVRPALSVRLHDDGTVHFESRGADAPAEPPAASAADTLLSALRRGQLVELAGDDGPRVLKLAWISPARKLFILSRHPDETVTFGGAELAFMLQRGQARIASEDSTIDRAIGSVTGTRPAADEAAGPSETASETA